MADSFILVKLQELREAIRQMTLKAEFITDLEVNFRETFGFPLGQIPVFLRSECAKHGLSVMLSLWISNPQLHSKMSSTLTIENNR